jgi:hypothetical protein
MPRSKTDVAPMAPYSDVTTRVIAETTRRLRETSPQCQRRTCDDAPAPACRERYPQSPFVWCSWCLTVELEQLAPSDEPDVLPGFHWSAPPFDASRPWVVAVAAPAMNDTKAVTRHADRDAAEADWARTVRKAEDLQLFGVVVELWHDAEINRRPAVEMREVIQ